MASCCHILIWVIYSPTYNQAWTSKQSVLIPLSGSGGGLLGCGWGSGKLDSLFVLLTQDAISECPSFHPLIESGLTQLYTPGWLRQRRSLSKWCSSARLDFAMVCHDIVTT